MPLPYQNAGLRSNISTESVYTNLLWMNVNIKHYILVSLHDALLQVALITALRYIISNPRLKQKLYV